jgi:hypothetical protein
VTYSEPRIAQTIEQRFVPVQVNVTVDTSKPIVENFHQVWTPDLRVLASDGFELYRWNGYLPPFEFLPQLLVAQAQACLRTHDEAGAAAIYDDVLCRFPTSAVAPEAQYFFAVATYKQSHLADDLLGNWQRLQSQYPESIWRIKQSFTEKRPAAKLAQAKQ